jgi:hypothetical protein
VKHKLRGTVTVLVQKLLGAVPSVAVIPEWQLSSVQQDQWQTESKPKKCGLIKKYLILMHRSKSHEVISILNVKSCEGKVYIATELLHLDSLYCILPPDHRKNLLFWL